MTTKQIGDFGENEACKFLEKGGIKVLKRNYRERGGEIDIIAKDGETIVFAEVKTRISKEYGTPAEFVDYKKQERIIKTAISYLGTDDVDMRFDVVEVLYKAQKDELSLVEINHIKGAF
ncbi:MAG: YraN family protein [Clostridia bacterium]|nr:YraN family protein [Clostridia bacterium]